MVNTDRPDENKKIKEMIEQIWEKYDEDHSGELDKIETRAFVLDSLGNLDAANEFSDAAFEELFKAFDADNSGTIAKSEMVEFIKLIQENESTPPPVE